MVKCKSLMITSDRSQVLVAEERGREGYKGCVRGGMGQGFSGERSDGIRETPRPS